MTNHPSHPDQLMARALGVCWHSPASDRWPCVCQLCGHAERQHDSTTACSVLDCDCDLFEGAEAPYEPSAGCDGDPIECNAEAALGEAEEKLRQVRNGIAEFEARAEAEKYSSTVTAEDEGEALVAWGRYIGFASAAKYLRELLP